jgi:hypothetical protein
MAPSSGSHAKHTAQSINSSRKVVAAVEVGFRITSDSCPPTESVLPPAKPLSFEATVDARPTLFHAHSKPAPAKQPPFPPPPRPGFELSDHENMTHRYSHHHHHASRYHGQGTKPTERSQPHTTRVINIPPPPPGFPGVPGVLVEAEPISRPTLTVYHVCRICLRPRSEKYHLEHPISSDGALSPPGICKRCRITSVEEKNDRTKYVHVEESDKVRVGISAFLPKDSLYTRQEASDAIRKQRRKGHGDVYVRECSSEEDDPGRVTYRYVKRTTQPVPEPPLFERPEVSVENLATMNLMNDQYSPQPETGRTTMKVNVGSDYADSPNSGIVRYPPQNTRVAEIRSVARSEPTGSLASTKSSGSSTSITEDQVRSRAKASVSVKSSVASSQSKVTATAQVATPAAVGYTESEIRTFARDEVERYRQAERMMHEHPNAYAHGRMVPVAPAVPVERRIEAVSDTAATRPWEVPSSPPREAAFATLQARNASSTSKDGTGRMERGPSEDSRHRRYPAGSPPIARSTSSTGGSSTVRLQSTARVDGNANERPYGHDAEITYQHERTQVPRRQPQREPPTSVKLNEVGGVIREAPIHAKQQSASSGRRSEPDNMEVAEKDERSLRTRVQAAVIGTMGSFDSSRAKIHHLEHDIDRRHRTKHTNHEGHKEVDIKVSSTEKGEMDWEDEGVRRSLGVRDSVRKKIHTESEAKASDRQPQTKKDVTVKKTQELFSMSSPRQIQPNLSSHGRSGDDSWYARRVKSVKKHQEIPGQPSDPPNPQDNASDKTIWHPNETPIRAPASSRLSMVEDVEDDDDWDWEYRKRIVTASDRPPGRRDDDSAPGRHYTDIELTFRRREPPQSSAHEYEIHTHSGHIQAKPPPREPPPRAPPIPEIVISTEVEQDTGHGRGRGPYMRNSEESAHVRFASKVDFSPTPPGSDESLPEHVRRSRPSSQVSKGSAKKSSLRHQIDGGASEPPESAESLFEEYEPTRAIRGPSVEREEELDLISAKYPGTTRGSAHSGSAAQHSTRSEPRSFRSQGSRRSTRTVEDDDHTQDAPPDESEHRSARSGRSGRSARRPSPDDAETATQLSRSRRLARALSESPSRERLQQEYVRVQQQQDQRSDTIISRGRQRDWNESQEDGKGPYREEARTESMDALYGSGHGRAKNQQREYVVRERW